jgi:hypothetical protein
MKTLADLKRRFGVKRTSRTATLPSYRVTFFPNEPDGQTNRNKPGKLASVPKAGNVVKVDVGPPMTAKLVETIFTDPEVSNEDYEAAAKEYVQEVERDRK